jgi:NAD(P)-dependent dehydrogenase (short-subunit alcohol dehydrogenase family)
VQLFKSKSIGIITGCGKGIGLASLRLFLESNITNFAIGISRSETPEIAALKMEYAGRLAFLCCDICSHETVNPWISNIISQVGFPDFAICNAGMRSRVKIHSATLEDYRKVLETNTISQINIVKHLADLKKDVAKPLKILAVSSIVGSRGFDELSTYGVSKAALEGFVKSAAIELAPENIQINCINPGFVRSSYSEAFKKDKYDLYEWTLSNTPMGRWGECDEIAKLSLFLVSQLNSYMSGSIVYCDGGWTSK